MRKFLTILPVIALAAFIIAPLSACSPEVGSKEWCAKMKEKDKGDWTASEAGDFAKHCIM